MKIKKFKRLLFLPLILIIYSCVGGKYTYVFNTGKNLDFSSGKWILNNVQSNSGVDYNKRFYEQTYEEFKKILGDSLIDLTSLRNTSLVGPAIEWEPSQAELRELYTNSDNDFLINVSGNIISNSASSFYTNEAHSNYSTSNRSSVNIKIFDLRSGILISSSKASVKSTEEHSELKKNRSLGFTSRAEPMMLRAIEGLILKYDKYRLDK